MVEPASPAAIGTRTPASRTPARVGYLALALALSGLLLYYSFRGLDWAAVGATLRGAEPARVLAWLAVGSLSLLLRAARWRVLLSAQAPVPFPTVFWATCAGYFGNAFLPARAGELVRTMVIRIKTGLSSSYVLTTALSERIVDAVTLVLISSLVLLILPTRPGWFAGATRVFVPLGVGGALAIVLLPLLEKLWRSLLQRLPLPAGLKQRVEGVLEQVLLGASALHNPSRLFRFLGLTAVIWTIDGCATMLGGWALHLAIPLPVAFLLVAGLGLGSALPSTPGYVGIYQFVAVSVLSPFGIARSDAVAYILLAQAIQYVSITAWGLLAFSKLGGWKRWTRPENDATERLVEKA